MFTRTIALTLALLACVASATEQLPTPKANAEDLSWDFGRVESGTPLEHKFALRNTGSAPLRIENVRISSKELKVRIPQSIAPGETGEVALTDRGVDVITLVVALTFVESFRRYATRP